MKSKYINEHGLGLIELLIAMAVASIAAGAIYSVYQSSVRSSVIQNTAAGVQQSVRAALELMVQDIRMAGYDPTGTAYSPPPDKTNEVFEVLQSEKIRITSDRNGINGIQNTAFERVTYELVNDELHQILYENSASQNTQVVINSVASLVFTPVSPATGYSFVSLAEADAYFDDNPSELVVDLFIMVDGNNLWQWDGTDWVDFGTETAIAAIDIALSVEENAGWGNTVERTLETRVFLRNM